MNRTAKIAALAISAVLVTGLTASPAAANRTWAAGLTIKPLKTTTIVVTPDRNRTWDSVTPLNRTWA